MTRPTLEVADIFRAHADNFIDKNTVAFQQLKVIRAITRCRTAALGGHVDICPQCGGDPSISYNSCRNRHCNKCQAQARHRWIDARKEELLQARYFHVVFTLPHELHMLVLENRAELYNLISHRRGNTPRGRAQSGASRSSDWFLRHPPYLGPELAVSSPCPLRDSRWRYLCESQLVDSSEVPVLSTREGSRQSLSWQVRRRTAKGSSQETADLRRIDSTSNRHKMFRGIPAHVVSSKLDCLCQAGIRRPGAGYPLPRPLHAPDCDLQPSARFIRCWSCHFPLAGLRRRQ
jgi:Transposase zinc-binding domain